MDLTFIAGGIGSVNWFMVVTVSALIIILYVVFSVMSKMGTSRGRKTKGKGDLLGIIADDSSNTIRHVWFDRIGDKVYVGTDEPLFLVIPSNVNIYRCDDYGGVPCVTAYARNMIVLPQDPEILSDFSNLVSDGNIEIDNEDVIKTLRKLFELEKIHKGYIRVSAPLTIATAYNIPRMISSLINKILGGAGESIMHFFRTAKNSETLRKYIETLGEYHEKKRGWIQGVGIAIFIILLGISLVLLVTHGHAPPKPAP